MRRSSYCKSLYIPFVVIGLLCMPCRIDAQSIRQGHALLKGVRDDIPVVKSSPKKNRRQTTIPTNYNVAQDTVYCIQTKKQHGWFAPVRIITKEEASHRSLSFRFTHRNNQGNWCKMELVNGYGEYTTGGMNPYILKVNSTDTDSLANTDWVEKIKAECIYEFISDPTGKNVIQERAYDRDMNIIYTYSRTPIGSDSLGHNKYVGSYKDCYGLPAEMRKDTTSTYTYGTLVMLTEDIWGNDSIIEYMDAKGLKKLNSDGAAMEVYICDKDGHQLKQQSQDSNGNLIIDNWGNCGVEYTWNPDHTIASVTYMDNHWQPMRMPSLRSTNGKDNVIRVHYAYDEYGRQIEQSYFTEKDIPDVNLEGIHKETSAFDEKGNYIEGRYYDLNNALINGSKGWAIVKIAYNLKGKITDIVWLDKDMKPCSTKGLWSKIHYEYDERGNEINAERFSVIDGIEKIVSQEKKRHNYRYNLWNDGTSRIDSIDSKGRQIKSLCFDSNGLLYVPDKWAKKITSYNDYDKRTVMIEETYGTKNRLIEVDGISKTISIIDSVGHFLSNYRYDKNGFLKETFGHLYDDNFNWVLAEYDMNKFGNICRAGGTAGVRHYLANVVYNQKHRFATLVGRDEFGEPDYITADGGNTYYYQKLPAHGKSVFYDEDNNPIEDFDKIRDALPKAMSIEVVDSSAYVLGFKDNDVILRYGSYINDLDSCDLYEFRNNWILHNVLEARKSKSMLVFRVNPETHKYGIVKIDSLKGTMSELGIMAHCRYLTHRQKERIESCFNEYKKEFDNINLEDLESLVEFLDHMTGQARIKVAYTELFRKNRNEPYPYYVIDPGLLIASYVPGKDVKWLCDGSTKTINNIIDNRGGNNSYSPLVQYYFTTDLVNIKKLNSMENYLSVKWSTIRVKDETYKKILSLTNEANKIIEKYQKEYLKKKKKAKETIESVAQTLNAHFPTYADKINGDYKGINDLVVYDFSGSRNIRDNAIDIISALQPNAQNGYVVSSEEGYQCILCMDSNRKLRISSAILFNSHKVIYASGSFSKVQLNRITNILK